MAEVTDRLLLFRLSGAMYAIGLESVAEIMEPAPRFPVPKAPHWLKGAINFHGAIVAVLDLAEFLSMEPVRSGGAFLVLDSTIAGCALWVDRVERVIPRNAVLGEEPGRGFPVDCVLLTECGEAAMLAVDELLLRVNEALAQA